MKKSKKILSVLLAMIIAMSAMSAMFVSFAAAPEDLAAKIDEYYAVYGNKGSTEEAIAKFEELAAEYKALTDAQKDAMDIETTSYLFTTADNIGNTIHKDADKAEKNNLIDQYLKDKLDPSANAIKAQDFAKWFSTVTLTGYQLKTDGTIKEWADKKLNSFTTKEYWMGAEKQGDTTLETLFAEAQKKYKDLGEAQKYVAMTYDYYGCRFNRLASYDPLNYLKYFFNMEKARMEALNPFTETAPKYVSKPNPDKFPGGESDPDYIAALELYNAYLADRAAYDKRKSLAETPWYASAWELIEDLDTDIVKDVKDTLFAFNDALALYVTDAAAGEAKLNELWNQYEALIASSIIVEKTFVRAENMYIAYCATIGKTANGRNLISEAKGVIGGPRVQAFVDAVNAATEPYTAEAVKAAQDKFALVFKESYGEIPAEVTEKFRVMLTSVPASEVKPELPEYVKGEVTYPKRVPAARVELLIAELDKQVAGLFTSMGYENGTDMMEKGVYTNYAVVAAMQTIYPFLKRALWDAGAWDAVTGMLKLDISPVGAAKFLTEDFYADAVALLNGTEEAPLATVEDWANVDLTKVTNGMFGFQDGDQEGFAAALAAMLRPVMKLLAGTAGVKLQNYYTEVSYTGGKIATKYNYGIYEQLIPVLEMLDVELYMGSKEYTALYEEAVAYDAAQKEATGVESYTAFDQLLTPILNPVFDLVENVLAAPMDSLVDLLPKLAHLLNDGVLNAQLAQVYSNLGMLTLFVSADMLVIDPATLVDTVVGMINGIELKPAVKDEAGNEIEPAVKLNLKLSAPDWEYLASLAAPVVKDSISADNAYRVGYETDKNAAFVVAFGYLFENITEENNLASINEVVNALVTDQATLDLINQLIGSLANMSSDKALDMICKLLNVPMVEDEKPTEEPSETPTEEPSETPTEPEGGNGEGPSVGDVAFGAFAAVALAAGAAFVLSRKKK